jgi:ABC-type antimicrobial peptide transport system permease subunit
MATIRERRPGVWEVGTFIGYDDRGRPTQVSRTVHGTKKDAKRALLVVVVRVVVVTSGSSNPDPVESS